MTSQAHPPTIDPIMISPPKPQYSDLLTYHLQTEREKLLQLALHDVEVRDAYQKGQLRGQQATIVLQMMYCERIRQQLAKQEEKKEKRKKGRLMGDGLPRLLNDAEFVAWVLEHEEMQREEATVKSKWKVTREKQSSVLKVWNAQENSRKERNKELTENWKNSVALWKEEVQWVKMELGGKLRWKKPHWGKLEPPIPKPKACEASKESEDSAGDSGEAFDTLFEGGSDESDDG